MEAALAPPHKKQATIASLSTRRCLVTGEVLPKEELIRFVVGPDCSIVPDLAQDLPGRGLWVKANRSVLEAAVKKNVFSKAAMTATKPGGDLPDMVETLLRKRCLDLLGFARRSGVSVVGQTQVESELKSGQLALLVVADDASQILSNRHNLPMAQCFSRQELGMALGHDQIVYLGLKSHGLTEKLKMELARLENMASRSPLSQRNE
jgi:uncharacterized protein